MGSNRQDTMASGVLFIVFISPLVAGFCFPGEDLKQCMTDDFKESDKTISANVPADELIETRSSFIHGRSCLANAGYFGSCRKVRLCRSRQYSYSQTCGFRYVCCEETDDTNQQTSPALPRRQLKEKPVRRRKPAKDNNCGVS